MKDLILETNIENANFYIASLAIGILQGMISGRVPLDCGTWSLARPIFWKALKECDEVDSLLCDCVSSFDELGALEQLNGDTNKCVDQLLTLLKISQEKSLKNSPSLAISASIRTNS